MTDEDKIFGELISKQLDEIADFMKKNVQNPNDLFLHCITFACTYASSLIYGASKLIGADVREVVMTFNGGLMRQIAGLAAQYDEKEGGPLIDRKKSSI